LRILDECPEYTCMLTLGSGEVLPAASSSTSNDEGDVADALLQIATKV